MSTAELRIGILCSSAGSTFKAIRSCLEYGGVHHRYLVLTDRPCGIEAYAAENMIAATRIQETSNEGISARAGAETARFGCDLVFLFYSRLVTRHLFDTVPTYNMHPSLLPAFKGFHSLEHCLEERPETFGCTIHRVDESIDGGEIILQVSQALPEHPNLEILSHLSFLQKVAAGISFLECIRTDRDPPPHFRFGQSIPGAAPDVVSSWSRFLEGEILG